MDIEKRIEMMDRYEERFGHRPLLTRTSVQTMGRQIREALESGKPVEKWEAADKAKKAGLQTKGH